MPFVSCGQDDASEQCRAQDRTSLPCRVPCARALLDVARVNKLARAAAAAAAFGPSLPWLCPAPFKLPKFYKILHHIESFNAYMKYKNS